LIRAILFPLRLLGSFLMAMARIYVCLIIGTVAVVLLSGILAPVGHVLAPVGSIIDLPFVGSDRYRGKLETLFCNSAGSAWSQSSPPGSLTIGCRRIHQLHRQHMHQILHLRIRLLLRQPRETSCV